MFTRKFFATGLQRKQTVQLLSGNGRLSGKERWILYPVRIFCYAGLKLTTNFCYLAVSCVWVTWTTVTAVMGSLKTVGQLKDSRTARGQKILDAWPQSVKKLWASLHSWATTLQGYNYPSHWIVVQLSKVLDSCSFVGGYSLVELNTSEQPCLLQAYESITADRISQGWF